MERNDFNNFGRGIPREYLLNYLEIGPLLQEMSFEENCNRRTDDGKISITKLTLSTLCSGELIPKYALI